MRLVSRLANRFSAAAPPEDPLIERLSEMPVPLAEVGSLVEGMEQDESSSGLALTSSRGDRKLGGIAQYELRFQVSSEGIEALGDEVGPMLQWVTQAVVLLSDPEAAARWFTTKTQRFEDRRGRDVDGFFYRGIFVDTLSGLGEEANVVVAYNQSGPLPFVDMYVNFRWDRLFAGVGSSTVLPEMSWKEYARAEFGRTELPAFDEQALRTPLTELARPLLARMEAQVRSTSSI
jgi:hypothetical protein